MTDYAESMPLTKHLGISIEDPSPDRIEGTMKVVNSICTLGGAVHGGALMAFADSLGAVGAALNLPDGAKGTTTVESKTNFVRPARVGDTLKGVAEPINVSRRLSVWQTRITRDDGKLVALITQSQIVL